MTISVITPTCDRPVGFALLERMMSRQTRQPDEWIVADGGSVSAVCTRGQLQIRNPNDPGVRNFLYNLLASITRANGELIAFCEDDDYYAPGHLAQLERQLIANPRALAAGDDDQRYYNLASRQFRTYKNVGACLCQTMIRRELVERFRQVVRICLERNSYGVDTNLWRGIAPARRALEHAHTVVGIKGLPGRAGLGVGHRPDEKWTADPELAQLRAWIGADIEQYQAILERAVA